MKNDRYDAPRRVPKGRSNAAKLAGAADIKRWLSWLELPWVHWGGSRPDIPFQPGFPFRIEASHRPLVILISSRLEGLRPGADRNPRALDKIVEDMAGWRSATGAALDRARAVLGQPALSMVTDGGPS